MGNFKEIVKRLEQTLYYLEQEYKHLEKTGVIRRSEDGYYLTKYYDSYGVFTVGEIRIKFFRSHGLFTVGDFCKKYSCHHHEFEGQIKRLYKLN